VRVERSFMNTRKVEVIRVGTINLDIDYPAKQIIRLRDVSGLYEGGPLKGLADAKKKIEAFKRGKRAKITEDHSIHVYDQSQLEPALVNLSSSVSDLHDRLRGKRLAGVNVDIWDQISGAYLGSYNTDENGTLILPTDKKFVEVLQWKLAGGGYSDCFNGERAAGTPGLFFYFPCNERSSTIKSFPGVSGQQASVPGGVETGWGWYPSGFFNRPALQYTTDADPLQLFGAPPVGRRSFQFLWYCSDPSPDRTIFTYSSEPMMGGADFALEVYYDGEKSVLRGVIAVGTSDEQLAPGSTELSANTWYLIQINTFMHGGYQMLAYEGFVLEMNVYLGGTTTPEISMQGYVQADKNKVNIRNTPLVAFSGGNNDGFDEIRHLDRELYLGEIADYAAFLKQGRVAGKSKGELGSVGW